MINWDNTTEPPPTKNIPIEDLKKIGSGEKKLTDFIPKIMCHSIGKKKGICKKQPEYYQRFVRSLFHDRRSDPDHLAKK